MRAGVPQGRVRGETVGRHFRNGDALRQIDAVMAGTQISDEAGDRDRHGIARTEQLNPHEGTGERRIRRAREHSDEADRREHARRDAEYRRERAAERRTDEEQRCHLAALEAGAERHDREQEL